MDGVPDRPVGDRVTYNFTSLIGSCMECGSAVYGVIVDGERVAVEYGRGSEPRLGLIALNPRTRGARVVTEQHMPEVDAWKQRGVTFHQRHSEQCVGRRIA